jgi:hypothetical protein
LRSEPGDVSPEPVIVFMVCGHGQAKVVWSVMDPDRYRIAREVGAVNAQCIVESG